MLSIIVAISENNGIGLNNNLLWHIPADLKHFKQITMGKTVVMGRRTWLSLPKRPLQGRRNIVISDIQGEQFEGAEVVFSIEEVINTCLKANDETVIIGGGSIYRQFFPFANKLYITQIYKSAEADTFFPEISDTEWEKLSEEPHLEEDIPFSYIEYLRK